MLFCGFLKYKEHWFQGTLFVPLSDTCDNFVIPKAATHRFLN